MAQHPSITQVSNEDIEEFDEREFPNYPVANVIIPGTRFTENTTEWDISILIADKYKNNNDESDPRTNEQTIPFYGEEDKMDVWANLLAVVNDVTAFIQRGVQGFDINGEIKCLQFHERFDSGLAGWVVTFTLTTHNNRNRCLFDLYPNVSTNYTLYYNVINYLKTIMVNHPGIGAVSMGDLWDFGERQFPQYTIANIQILEADFGVSVSNFKCQLMIADKVKNKNNESDPRTNAQTIPYYQVDDKVDIYANTLAIINDLTSFTQRSMKAFEISDDIVCTPFADRLDNGVAGWTAEFTLTTHNDRNRCLFELYPQ
jgi:hypothetical protein